MKTEEKHKKKIKLKWQVKLILYVIIIVLYSFFIGTKGMFVKDYVIKSKKINDAMHGIKIAHFSDLHYGSSVKYATVKSLVKKINDTNADIIVFTGDLINKDYNLSKKEKEKLIKELSKIRATYNIFYINGEEDNELSEEILNSANFININKTEKVINLKNSSKILISGIDSENLCKYDDINPDFKIIAIHNPDDIDDIDDCTFDVALAGHTHNGQINIYKVKDFIISSRYKKTYQKINGTRLFINPGIGTSKINVRLFNHPTINLYRLNKA